MNVVEFFGTVIKPKLCKGKYMFAPLGNEQVTEGLYALRDKDVNAFIYHKGNATVAIDCGYKNSNNMTQGLVQLNINPETVSHLFLTHLDLDHAGGVDKRCRPLYPNATIYLGRHEHLYATGALKRKKIGPFGFNSPIRLSDNVILLDDEQTIIAGEIKVKALFLPGHTLGHVGYLVDDRYLFTGDSIILVQGQGYCFYNQWNVNSQCNMEALQRLKNIKDVEMVITSHSGYTKDIEDALAHIHELPLWRQKGFRVNDHAPYDPYH